MAAFPNLNSASGLKKLDDHLLTRSYITGYQASKDDIIFFAALSKPPTSQYVNASRWFNHIDALLRISYQASKDDITVFAALSKPPTSQYVNASRWFNHIDTLLRISGLSAEGSGVTVEGSAPITEEAVATPPTANSKLKKMMMMMLIILERRLKKKSKVLERVREGIYKEEGM